MAGRVGALEAAARLAQRRTLRQRRVLDVVKVLEQRRARTEKGCYILKTPTVQTVHILCYSNLPLAYHVISPAVVEVLLLVVVPLPVLLVLLRRHRRHGVRELLRAGVERQLRMVGNS